MLHTAPHVLIDAMLGMVLGVTVASELHGPHGAAPLELAGIVAEEPAATSNAAKASTSKTKAKAKKDGNISASVPEAPTLENGDESDSLLGPRRAPENKAGEFRSRAKLYQQGQVSGQSTIPKSTDPAADEPSGKEGAHDAKARARAYAQKSKKSNELQIEKIGADGIPVVTCSKSADNTAGRIGDDAEPGGVFYIMRDNKPYKVRCGM